MELPSRYGASLEVISISYRNPGRIEESKMTSDEQKTYVERFFKAWEKGSSTDIRAAYAEFLADDCIYENSGIAPLVGKQAILEFVGRAGQSLDVATMHVEVQVWGFGKESVFTERVDYHRNAAGDLTLAPRICGVMIFAGRKIARWSDYYDPAAMLHGLGTRG
jgi:limonene-1,2-epoxide hydrolase